MNYTEKNTLENKVENILLNEIKKNPRDIETIKTYALCKQAYELENIREILWDIKHLLVKGQ